MKKEVDLSKPKPYKLIVKTILKSKAKLFGFLPTKSFVSGEIFEIRFQFENLGEETFPRADILWKIEWPSMQTTSGSFRIGPFKKNQFHGSPPITTEALCEGFGLIYIIGPLIITDEQQRRLQVEYYKRKDSTKPIDTHLSIASINAKSKEEIYEFWAMIISAAGLAIIALEKILSFVNWLITNQFL